MAQFDSGTGPLGQSESPTLPKFSGPPSQAARAGGQSVSLSGPEPGRLVAAAGGFVRQSVPVQVGPCQWPRRRGCVYLYFQK
jgi:hypothetical protein